VKRILIRLIVVAAVAGLGVAGWFALRPRPLAPGFQGYVEGYLVYMGAEDGGRIVSSKAEPGEQVQPGQFLFALDPSVQEAQKREAEARLNQMRAQLANLESAVQRPEQIAILKSQEERAKAQLDYSRTDLDRQRTLFLRGYSAQARLDQAESAFERDKAALAEVQNAIAAGEIAGRQGEIRAAEGAMRMAEAALAQAETRLAKRRVSAETAGVVQDVFFRAGEVVMAGQPVLSLLPPGNRRIRFYVPEPVLATIALGAPVAVTCDSCPTGLAGKISFIAQEAEYTPPVIFSREERRKLVFRVEAQLAGDSALPLGLPVTVLPTGAAR
jgi:HlyD family secretion protein